MIVSLPDKNMTIQFPDDMELGEVESQIMVGVYDEGGDIQPLEADTIEGGLTPETIEAIPDPIVRAFAEGRVSAIQQEAVEKAVSAPPGPERQIHLDNLISVNVKIAETKKIAENLEQELKETKEEQSSVKESVGKGVFIPPEIAERYPEVIPPEDIIEKHGGKIVHTMPDGSTMEGPMHEGAVPGSERRV